MSGCYSVSNIVYIGRKYRNGLGRAVSKNYKLWNYSRSVTNLPSYHCDFIIVTTWLLLNEDVPWNKQLVHTHTHPFNGPFSGTIQVSRYQKGKTNLDFTEARDSEWQWDQLCHLHVCTLLQADSHTSTPPLSFLQAGCPSCCPTNSVKALKANKQSVTGRLFGMAPIIGQSIISAPLIFTKFSVTIETTKWSSWVVPVGAQQIQDGGWPSFWKNVKSPYICDRSTDLDEI